MATSDVTVTILGNVTGVTGGVTTTEVIPVPKRKRVQPKTAREALAHAARYIEEHGWAQGFYYTKDGKACMLGAIMAVTKHQDYGVPDAAERRLRKHLPGGNIPQWNDAPGRTEQEVLAALRFAALRTVNER